ncbi:uncharacterized protein LOC135930254 [Gordionus sp. m RMFG-2023]|uniref:uncharacterized protein LOC135930254 n=1 Tax=Gordionus sp. m RMFG-2023 TaxID=3053472 RepID=UPI0031FC42CD
MDIRKYFLKNVNEKDHHRKKIDSISSENRVSEILCNNHENISKKKDIRINLTRIDELMLLGDNNSLNIRDLDSIVIDYQKDDQILEIVLENEKSNPIIQVIPIVDVVDERSAVNLRQSRVQNMDSTLPFDISNYVQLDVVPKDFNILESIYRPPNNFKFPRDLSRRKLKF